MDLHIVIFLLCVVFACASFLGHAVGYRRGELAASRRRRSTYVGRTE